jgi:hypothetical protein
MDGSTSITTKYSDRHPSPLSKTEGKEVPNGAKISSGEQLLAEGSKIHARITDFVGKQLTLKLDDGTTVLANTSAATHLAIGQSADFEVLRSTSEQLLIKLLSGSNETVSGSMAGRALTAAGLPVNEENAALVNTLLDNLLPVDQESLQKLAKDMKMFPDADPVALAKMRLHNMPVNQHSIAQYEAYAHYEHQLMPKLSEFAEALSSPELAPLLEEAGFTFSDTVITQEPGSEAPAAQANAETASVPENTAGAENVSGAQSQPAGVMSETTPEGAVATGNNEISGSLQASAAASEGAEAQGVSHEAGAQSGTAQAGNSVALQGNTEGTAAGALSGSGNMQGTGDVQQSSQTASPENAAIPHSSSAPGERGETVSGNKFLDHWTLTPKQLTEGKNLEDLYERLERDLTNLSKALKSIKEKHPELSGELAKLVESASKQAENLKDNLDFMNILNRYFPYVQLPVRLKDSYTQGELYVYKRNRSKKSDGSSSVMLHLDMEHLGKTDIYLNLAGKNLTTRFYLEDDTVKLFETHLNELTDRLESLGLSVSCEILPQKEAEDPVRRFLVPQGSIETGHYRFDRKA